MTIEGWWGFAALAVLIGVCGFYSAVIADKKIWKAVFITATILLILGIFFGIHWIYNNTASGRRALISQKSELENGMERTITVYTADGKVIAQYKGKIDVEKNDGGYIMFDFEGKRYIYYNCFIECIGNIE